MVSTSNRRIKASRNASEPIPFVRLVEIRPTASLKPYARNSRTHSDSQIRQIAESIRAFGFNKPVLIDGNDEIIAGHGVVEAAKLLALESVPTIRLEHLSEAEKRAYILADNRIAEMAGWDKEILAIELQNLIEMETEFSITATGFEIAEIDSLLEILDEDKAAETEEPPPDADPGAPVVSRLGDLWQLGQQRVLCGDARDPLAYARLLEGEKARLIITDPPYNVPVQGHVSGLGQVKHDDFIMASGEMREPEFTTFLATVFTNLAAYSFDGSIHFVFTDWRHLYEFLHAGRLVYSELKNLVVWAKTNAGMGSFYRSQHELILVFKNGRARHINNFELGQHGRYRTNLWTYPGANSLQRGRDEQLALHPTVKPVGLYADAMLDCSAPGDLVLDVFCGSGTVFLAAERTRRRACALELDPRYVDVAVRRWEKTTGETAVHAQTGDTFKACAARVSKEAEHGGR
jgi:DNA modification methylase